MRFLRGIIALVVYAILGPIAVIVVVAVYTLLSWRINGTVEIDRRFEIAWRQMHAVPPLLGTSIYLGSTAWATYTPKLKCSFARTLAIITALSLPLTWVLGILELTPKRLRSIQHPDMYLSEFLLVFLPPFLIACVLIAIRWSQDSPPQSSGSPLKADCVGPTPT